MILIRVVDNKWMDHIDAMDQLKSGIGLQGTGRTGSCSGICAGRLRHVRADGQLHQGRVREVLLQRYGTDDYSRVRDVIGTGEKVRKDEYRGRGSGWQAARMCLVRLQSFPKREHKQQTVQQRRPEGWQKRPMPMRQRQKIQTLLWEDDSPRVAR